MKVLTVAELFDKVWAAYWDCPRFQASGWAKEVRNLYSRHIAPTFGTKSLGALKASQIRAWHAGAAAATPTDANRALEVLTRLYSYAEEMGWRPAGSNPARQVKAHKERKRKRFATPEEIAKIAAILDREAVRQPQAVAFLFTLLFSGARPRSIERSTWNNLTTVQHENQTFGVLTFYGKSTAETGEDEQVMIPPQAMTHIERLRTYRSPHREGAVPIFGIKMPRGLWDSVRKEAGCPDLWARDLRRTFGVVGLSNGVALGAIGQLLNHKSNQTTMRYVDLFQNKRLEATKQIADQIDLILKGGSK